MTKAPSHMWQAIVQRSTFFVIDAVKRFVNLIYQFGFDICLFWNSIYQYLLYATNSNYSYEIVIITLWMNHRFESACQGEELWCTRHWINYYFSLWNHYKHDLFNEVCDDSPAVIYWYEEPFFILFFLFLNSNCVSMGCFPHIINIVRVFWLRIIIIRTDFCLISQIAKLEIYDGIVLVQVLQHFDRFVRIFD